MKYLSFNSRKSLEKEKLIFEEPFLLIILEHFQYFILIIAPIIFGLAFFYVQLYFQNPVLFPFSIVTLLLSFLITLFIFLQIKKTATFRKIKGKGNRKENMNLIESICNRNDWKILHTDNHSHVILIENLTLAYHNGRELFILCKDDKVYIKCLTYSIHDLKSPFHWNSQRKIENMFIEKIVFW